MGTGNSTRGSVKAGITVVIAMVALAGIASAVMFRSDQSSMRSPVPAASVKGTSFDEPAPANAAVPAKDSPAAVPAATPSDASTGQATAEAPKAATAADIPSDISKIPSATPVPRVEVASVAGGSPPVPPADNSPSIDASGYKELNFQLLAGYKYIEPVPREGAKPEETEAERKKNQIPADVVALNGSMAAVEGWMVPMQVDDNGGVKTFVLVKTQPQCCFGDTQKMNEWIDVAMPDGKTAEFNVDRPIKVYGKLEVGEKIEDGFVLSIYRMKADKVSG